MVRRTQFFRFGTPTLWLIAAMLVALAFLPMKEARATKVDCSSMKCSGLMIPGFECEYWARTACVVEYDNGWPIACWTYPCDVERPGR